VRFRELTRVLGGWYEVRHLQAGRGSIRSRCDRRNILAVDRAPKPGTYTSSDGAEVLHFLWRLGDKEGEGVDMLRFDEDGIHAQEEPRPAVVDASAGVDVTFTEIGPPELKGISGVRLHAGASRESELTRGWPSRA
jgi:hypothetical protein